MMKTMLIALVLAAELFAPAFLPAQGTLRVSNLGRSPSGSASIASDSWIAQGFFTGTNSAGYLLESVQLLMNPAIGNPSNFILRIYRASGGFGNPGATTNGLGGLTGLEPSAGGVFTYSSSGVKLSATTYYYVVATSETPVALGAYVWSAANGVTEDLSTRWIIDNRYYSSPDGSIWTQHLRENVFQLGIYATAVPEPAILGLAALCGLLLLWHHRKARAVD